MANQPRVQPRQDQVIEWGGWGSNPRPKDYESSALTD